MFTGPAEGRLMIRERFDAYSDAVCRIDLDAYVDCWTDDCIRTGTGGEFRGKDELRAHWAGIWQVVDRMVFMTQIGAIEVEGDHATARSYCLETLMLKGGSRRRLIGMYTDELRRVGQSWAFAVRQYEVLVDEGRIDQVKVQ